MSYHQQQRVYAATVDKTNNNRRIDEQYKKDLERYNHEVNMLSRVASNDRRLEFQRRENEIAEIAAEEQIEKQMEERENARRTYLHMQEQNSRIAEELQRTRAEAARHEVEINRICSESEELKDLEKRLKLAYLNKDRAAQHKEKQLVKKLQEEIEQAVENSMEHDRQMAKQGETEKAILQHEMARKQREALDKQLFERQQLLEEAAKQAELERRMVAEVVDAVEREDQAEIEHLVKKREETRNLIRENEQNRLRAIEERRKLEAQEEENIRKHHERIVAREALIEAERRRKKAIAEENFRTVVNRTEKMQLEEEELRSLRDMLWEEELAAKKEADEREKAVRTEKAKIEMMKSNQEQLRQREIRKERERISEMARYEAMKIKFAEDEAREQAQMEARERVKIQHRESIQKQKYQREQMYERERALELQELQHQKEQEEYKKRVVAEARRRLLEQHASALDGYLPKGALKNAEELQYIKHLAQQGRKHA